MNDSEHRMVGVVMGSKSDWETMQVGFRDADRVWRVA